MVKGTTKTKAAKVSAKKKKEEEEEVDEEEGEGVNVEAMTVAQLKEELSQRGLITKGLKADLVARLAARLEREKDPAYKPRGPEKTRICPWCNSVLVKKVKPRSDRIDRFYACPSFPDCTYTENMSGHSKKKKITNPAERAKLSQRAKQLGQSMQNWKRSQWADYNSR